MHPIDELKRLVAARAKATEGKWTADSYPCIDIENGFNLFTHDTASSVGTYADATFIALAGSIDLAAILAAWERDRAMVERLPKTKDGEYNVYPVFHPELPGKDLFDYSYDSDDCPVGHVCYYLGGGDFSLSVPYSACYSTRELALAARAAESEASNG